MRQSFLSLREIRFPGVPSPLSTAYSPGICPSYQERELLSHGFTPRKVKIEYNLANSDTDRLYWKFVTGTSAKQIPLSSARNHYQRRWNTAFGRALKMNGFDYKGRRLDTSPEQSKRDGLKGTLEVKLFVAAHWDDKDLSRMERHSDSIVKGLMAMQMKNQRRDYANHKK